MTSTSARELNLGGPPRVGPNAVPDQDDAQLTIPGSNVATRKRGGRKTKHRVASRHERAGRKAGVPIRPISLSMPATAAGEWRTYSQRVKRSLVDVMLDAIVTNKDRLPEIVRTHQSTVRTGRQPISDGLFLRTSAEAEPARQVADEPETPLVTVPLRMLSTNVDTLDQLVYESAADSRSQFVLAVLTAFLADRQAEAEARALVVQSRLDEVD